MKMIKKKTGFLMLIKKPFTLIRTEEENRFSWIDKRLKNLINRKMKKIRGKLILDSIADE